MITINVINFWNSAKLLEQYNSWILLSLFNITKLEFQNLRTDFKNINKSNLYLIANKLFNNKKISFNLLNSSIIILPIRKNLYYFSNKLIYNLKSIFYIYKKQVKLLGYNFLNNFILDSTAVKYREFSITYLCNFFIILTNTITLTSILMHYMNNIFTVLIINILNFYIGFFRSIYFKTKFLLF